MFASMPVIKKARKKVSKIHKCMQPRKHEKKQANWKNACYKKGTKQA